MALSPVFLEELKINSGSIIDVELLEGYLAVKPVHKPKYTLADLLAQCDAKAKISKDDKQWLELTPAGNEIL